MKIKRNENEGIMTWIYRSLNDFSAKNNKLPKSLELNNKNLIEFKESVEQLELFKDFGQAESYLILD